jgi:2-polyprenyl-3-methyl-5-hydroxy-6-metoxy-1,4-benzoquinol methylase
MHDGSSRLSPAAQSALSPVAPQEDASMKTHERETATNPYRDAFYSRQAEWHGYENADVSRIMHENRIKYYRWYTKDWLPESRSTPVLDIGCGSGQFLYFLRDQGYTGGAGIDVDLAQIEIGQALGLKTTFTDALDFLNGTDETYGLITMLDILEHFTMQELFTLLEAVSARLAPGGKIIASVPNGDSPQATCAVYADITHEIAFTPTSLGELFFCHGLRVTAFRDPWPAPVSPLHAIYRKASQAMRGLEAIRLRSLGLGAPKYWSSVIWVQAEKPMNQAVAGLGAVSGRLP